MAGKSSSSTSSSSSSSPPSSSSSMATSDFERMRRSLLKSGQLFEDPDFAVVTSSVFYHESPPFSFSWKRPHEITSNPQFLSLPSDSCDTTTSTPTGRRPQQPDFESTLGRLGDPWFVSSISTLYLTKGLFYRVVPADQSFDSCEYAGIFRFRIWWFGQWQEVLVDDRLPTVGSNNKLAFVQPLDGKVFWPCLLEKAFAKLHGSYEALKYGTSIESLADLTGGVTELIDLKTADVTASSHLNTRILLQRLLSITSIVTAVAAVDESTMSQSNDSDRHGDHRHRDRHRSHHHHDRDSHRHVDVHKGVSPENRAREQFVFGERIHSPIGFQSRPSHGLQNHGHHNSHHHQHLFHNNNKHHGHNPGRRSSHESPSSLSDSSSEHSLVHNNPHRRRHHDQQHHHHHHHSSSSSPPTSRSSSSSCSGGGGGAGSGNMINTADYPFPRLPGCGIIGNSNYRIVSIERVETVIGENREQVFLLKLVNSLGTSSSRHHGGQYTGPFGDRSCAADWSRISDSDRVRLRAMDEDDDDFDEGIDEEDDEDEGIVSSRTDVLYHDFYLRDRQQRSDKGKQNKSRKKGSSSFWIEFSDFMKIFTHLEVVYLDGETSRDEPTLRCNHFPMTVKLYRGSWRRGVTAGGCRNNGDSFHQNPQIELTLALESDDMTIVCLNQHSVLEPQVVGFSIYHLPHGSAASNNNNQLTTSATSVSPVSTEMSSIGKGMHQRERLDRLFFKRNKSLLNSSYSNSRQVLLRCSLDRGSYVLMPTSFEPGFEGGYTIRVYSMKGIKLRLLDRLNSMTKTPILKSPPAFDSKFTDFEEVFMAIADEHKCVTSHDLQQLLDSSLPNDYVKSCATIEVCRLVISALEQGSSSSVSSSFPGRLHFKDYKNIMCSLRFWQNVFKNHTKGTTGILRVEKLEEAISEIGFCLSADVLSALVLKFMRKDYTLRFGDFVAVILHLTISFTNFNKFVSRQQQKRSLTIQAQHQQSSLTPAIKIGTAHHLSHHHAVHGMDANETAALTTSPSSVSLSLNDWLKVSFQT